MQQRLNLIFERELFARIEALQINQVELPSSFQDAILESISTKQNITRSMRYKDNMQARPPRRGGARPPLPPPPRPHARRPPRR